MRVPSARSPGVGLAKVPQRAYLDLAGATAWDISPVGSRGNLDLMQYALIFFDVQLILAQMGGTPTLALVGGHPSLFVFLVSQRYHRRRRTTSGMGRSAMPKLDKQEQRIASIFGTPDVPAVDTETLEHYLDHLQQHLTLPCQLTGIEDFDWEEYYVIGPGSKAEHERLRKTRPS